MTHDLQKNVIIILESSLRAFLRYHFQKIKKQKHYKTHKHFKWICEKCCKSLISFTTRCASGKPSRPPDFFIPLGDVIRKCKVDFHRCLSSSRQDVCFYCLPTLRHWLFTSKVYRYIIFGRLHGFSLVCCWLTYLYQ